MDNQDSPKRPEEPTGTSAGEELMGRVELWLPGPMLKQLDHLLATGLYGRSRAEAAERTIALYLLAIRERGH